MSDKVEEPPEPGGPPAPPRSPLDPVNNVIQSPAVRTGLDISFSFQKYKMNCLSFIKKNSKWYRRF